MSKFTKTLTAAAVAVAMTGPAAADVNTSGAYEGSKTTIKIKPAGCPNDTTKNVDTVLGFDSLNFIAVQSGLWAMEFFSFSDLSHIEGPYIERKAGKDLTTTICGPSWAGPNPGGSILGSIEDYLDSEPKCDFDGINSSDFESTGRVKLSKNGDRAAVDMKVSGTYDTIDAKVKNVKASIKGKLDFVSGSLRKPDNNDCDVIPPPPEPII